jgi:hypothetical protein
MQETPRTDSPTVRTHKRQFIWQILLPMILVVLLGLTAGGFVIAASMTGTGQSRVWADVSTIWLIAPMLIFALLFVVLLGALIYGIAKLLKVTPRYTGKAQFYVALAAAGTRKVADGATKPVVWIRQIEAAIKSFFNKL